MTETPTPAAEQSPGPGRDRCAACGGPMHDPTWGCVRPHPAEDQARDLTAPTNADVLWTCPRATCGAEMCGGLFCRRCGHVRPPAPNDSTPG